jgi:hypothetical protein
MSYAQWGRNERAQSLCSFGTIYLASEEKKDRKYRQRYTDP